LLAIERTRQDPGGGGLADPAGSGEQEGVVESAEADGVL